MTYEEYVERLQALLDDGDVAGAQRLLDQASFELSAEETAQLAGLMSGTGPARAPEDPEMTSYKSDIVKERQQTLNDRAMAEITDPASDGGVLVTDEERKAAEEAGVTEGIVPTYVEPEWILGEYGQLSSDQKDRIVEKVRLYTGQEFHSFEELVNSGFLDEPIAEVATLVNSAIYDTTLERGWQFELPSGSTFTVRDEDWVSAGSTYGLQEQDMTSLIKMADMLNVRDSAGNLNWRPFLALMESTGLLDQLKPTVEQRRIAPGRGSTRTHGVDTKIIEADPSQAIFQRQMAPGVNLGVLRGEGLSIQTNLSARDVAAAFQEGLQRYDDQAMAFIYAQDPALAGRIDAAGGDVGKIRPSDLQKVAAISSKITGEAWWSNSGTTFISNFLQLDALRNQAMEDTGGSGGRTVVRQYPDEASLNETFRTLYQSMFFEEPDEAQLAAFRSKITSAIDAAEPGQEIDPTSRAKEMLRSDPRYEELYGRKASTVSDEQYRAMHLGGQINMLGDELAGNKAAMAGMRSGKYQTTIGAAAGTREAWDNSTFLGRLARIGQLVGEMT